MNIRIFSSLITALFLFASAIPAFAQEKIDKLVSKIENNPDVSVTYTEKRNPKTRKMIKQSTILSGADKKTAESLWRVFEEERQNSVSVTKQRNKSFVMKFIKNNMVSSYILSIDGSWSLVISKRPVEDDDMDDYSFNVLDFSGFDDLAFEMPGFNLDGLNSLSELDGLNRLNELDGLGSHGSLNNLGNLGNSFETFNGNVKVYDKNGNLIFEKSNGKSGKSKSKSKSTSTSSSSSSSSNSTKNVRTTHTITTTTIDGKTYQTISL